MTSDFNVDVQKLFLEIMLTDAEAFVRVQTSIMQTTLIKVYVPRPSLLRNTAMNTRPCRTANKLRQLAVYN